MSPRAPVLVLGVGNGLFTDEGVGVTAARRVAQLDLPGVDLPAAALTGRSPARDPVLAATELTWVREIRPPDGTGHACT